MFLSNAPLLNRGTKQWEVLETFARNPGLQNKELAELTGLTERSTRMILSRLSSKLGTGGTRLLIAYYWICVYQDRVLSYDEFWALMENTPSPAA